jgi:hypothetical protein
MDIKQINSAIMFGQFTNTELSSIIDAVKWARNQLTENTKRSLRVGDSVQFTSNRNGMTYTGKIEKIAIKFVTVNTNAGRWKVPANMLTAV